MKSKQTSENMLYVYLLSGVAALGGLLFGYDTAVISGAIGFLENKFELDAVWKGWAASSALIGCILGAASAGVISDRVGRRTALRLSAVLFLVSAIGTALPRTLTEFVIFRIVGGVGVGMASMLSPLYIAEAAPARIRGRLVSLNQLTIVFGMLVVYFVNAIVASQGNESWNITTGWRWMFGSEAIPASLFLICLLFVPESPRWLIKRNREVEARRILSRISGEQKAQEQLSEIKDAIEHETASISILFQPGFRIAMVIGICLAVLQQVTGINVVLYYAPEIFKNTGMVSTAALNDTVIIGVVNMIFTLVAIWVVDKVGRKPLLLIASGGMGVSLTLLGYCYTNAWFEGPWVLIFILTYVASFATAMGAVVWVVMSEIFPTRVRGTAMSFATVCLWIACFLVSQFFPVMLDAFEGRVFFIYAFMCAISYIFILMVVPETKGKTLEEIEKYWMNKHR